MKKRKNNNNDEYLERLTRTGPKRLHFKFKSLNVPLRLIRVSENGKTCSQT